ncbi:uncharacterized protein [Glycine max]|uniref:uncharacterized protein isoform X3 n=1 Tax=Glycine max TaxID=3847 RepID=UPI001B355E78|nr:uncharacterized protein LOC102667562 isoform X3 [Glycine max]
MGGWNDKRNDDIDALLGADEKLEDFDDDQENKENKEGVVVEEEMDEAFNFRLNGIGSNVATGWWFVNEGEAVLLAHHDGSCTYYDITNSEARNNARILISGSFSNRYERITRCAKGWESNQVYDRKSQRLVEKIIDKKIVLSIRAIYQSKICLFC